jgi:hypothetical protein
MAVVGALGRDITSWWTGTRKHDLSQPAKTLVPSYYCLYSLYNKIINKGKIVSAGY